MSYDHITYVIFDASNVGSINFSEVIETSVDTLRYSIDRSQTILKFTGNTPSFYYLCIYEMDNDNNMEWELCLFNKTTCT